MQCTHHHHHHHLTGEVASEVERVGRTVKGLAKRMDSALQVCVCVCVGVGEWVHTCVCVGLGGLIISSRSVCWWSAGVNQQPLTNLTNPTSTSTSNHSLTQPTNHHTQIMFDTYLDRKRRQLDRLLSSYVRADGSPVGVPPELRDVTPGEWGAAGCDIARVLFGAVADDALPHVTLLQSPAVQCTASALSPICPTPLPKPTHRCAAAASGACTGPG